MLTAADPSEYLPQAKPGGLKLSQDLVINDCVETVTATLGHRQPQGCRVTVPSKQYDLGAPFEDYHLIPVLTIDD